VQKLYAFTQKTTSFETHQSIGVSKTPDYTQSTSLSLVHATLVG